MPTFYQNRLVLHIHITLGQERTALKAFPGGQYIFTFLPTAIGKSPVEHSIAVSHGALTRAATCPL